MLGAARAAGACLSACLLVSGCAPAQRQAGDEWQGATTLVYECGEVEFVAQSRAGEILLYLPGDRRVLSRERSASGERYSDSEVTLWSKGEEASLDIGTRRYRGCRLNRARAPWEEARRRGVDFRAVGQEPGWYLEIQHARNMLFVAGYGERRVLLPTPDPEFENGWEVYRAGDQRHRLQVQVRLHHCTDSMSGQVYDNEVLIEYDGDSYRGCGLALEQIWE